MNNCKISVLMSTFEESEEILSKSIESILNQTYSYFEFIIILDKPENNMINQIVTRYKEKDNRIKFYVNKKNLGLAKSLNKALELSTSKYIARMDADDIALNFRLEKQMNYLRDKDLDLIGANYVYINNNGKEINVKTKRPLSPEGVYKRLVNGGSVAHPTWFGKRIVFEKLQGYRNFYTCEDYDFLLRACKLNFKIGNLEDICLKYRLTPNSISRSNPIKQGLTSSFLRDNYACLFKITERDIDDYLESFKGKKDSQIYNQYLILCNKLMEYKQKKLFISFICCAIKIVFHSKYGREKAKRKIYLMIYE